MERNYDGSGTVVIMRAHVRCEEKGQPDPQKTENGEGRRELPEDAEVCLLLTFVCRSGRMNQLWHFQDYERKEIFPCLSWKLQLAS